MIGNSHDKAPDMMSIKVNFDDESFAQLSIPEEELNKLPSADRGAVIDSAAFVMGAIMRTKLPRQEDYKRVMSIEGVSLILPESHGPIEIQTLIGEQIITGTRADLAKYDEL